MYCYSASEPESFEVDRYEHVFPFGQCRTCEAVRKAQKHCAKNYSSDRRAVRLPRYKSVLNFVLPYASQMFRSLNVRKHLRKSKASQRVILKYPYSIGMCCSAILINAAVSRTRPLAPARS